MVPKRRKGRNKQWLLLRRKKSRPLHGWGRVMGDGKAGLVNPIIEKKPVLKKGR